MKKILTSLLLAVSLVGCSSKTVASPSSEPTETSEPEYTITTDVELNGFTTKLPGYSWIGSEVGNFKEVTMKESVRLFEEKGSGLVVYSYVGCPWCERFLPQLNQVALKTGVTIYYVDANIFNDEETEIYPVLTEYLSSILDKNDDGEYEMYVPLFIGVKDGELVGSHNGLVDSFDLEDDTSQMSDEQKEELQNIFLDIVKKVAD